MAIPVLLILAVLWAAVLIPPILRSRNAGQGSTIGDYTQRLGVLGNHSVSHLGRTSARPRRHLHVVPPTNGSTRRPVTHARPPATNRARANGAVRPVPVTSAAQKRRRDVLFLLAGAAGATLLLLLVMRSPMLIVLQLLTDIALVSYIYLLIRYTNHRPVRAATYASTPATTSSRTVVSIRHPDPPARPELAPVPEFALYRTASR